MLTQKTMQYDNKKVMLHTHTQKDSCRFKILCVAQERNACKKNCCLKKYFVARKRPCCCTKIEISV